MLNRLKKLTRDQCTDAALAFILMGLLMVQIDKKYDLLPWIIILTILVMIKPTIVKPFAFLWFWLSKLFGAIISKVLLSFIFFLVVTPIGLIRRMAGKDTLRLRVFRKSSSSVFRKRSGVLGPQDLEQMF
ncbi:conserved hypothetical protein [Desulfovibrionales bacterium]